jgi:hypothetical protein
VSNTDTDITTTKSLLLEALKQTKEAPESLVCLYRAVPEGGDAYDVEMDAPIIRCSVAELPEREFDDGFGGVEGEPFIAFGPEYVYVKGCYDGSEWISAVPRHPDVAKAARSLPCIGGG